MKTSKILIILILLFLVIIISLLAITTNNKREYTFLKKYNIEYEEYLNKTITGTELATIINKAVNQNEYNNIEKDERNHFIDNKENSINIEIEMSITNKTYSMEEFYNHDTSEFVKYFGLENFVCTNIDYHMATGKISKMYFKQV